MIAFGKTPDEVLLRFVGMLHTELEKVEWKPDLLPKRVTPLPESYSEVRIMSVEVKK